MKAGWTLERLVTGGTHYQVDDIGAAGMHAIAQAPALVSLRDLEIETAVSTMRHCVLLPSRRNLIDHDPMTDMQCWRLTVFRVVSAVEARTGLVLVSVFKTDGAPRERRHGGFDSHAPPPY